MTHSYNKLCFITSVINLNVKIHIKHLQTKSDCLFHPCSEARRIMPCIFHPCLYQGISVNGNVWVGS